MAPVVSVLQLDTAFPRVPGDVGCRETYIGDIEIITVKGATVSAVVSNRPDLIDIQPFEDALAKATGDVVVTSCGFLSYWQEHLDALIDRPFISSSLTALADLNETYDPSEVMIVTFDADNLTHLHLGPYPEYKPSIVGLPKHMHLRKVIGENLSALDQQIVADELTEFLQQKLNPQHKHLLLECTNLPPYKESLHAITPLLFTDILTQIEQARPNTIRPEYL